MCPYATSDARCWAKRPGRRRMTVVFEQASDPAEQLAACRVLAHKQQQPAHAPTGPTSPTHPRQPLSGNWHLRLAALMVTLRGCLLGPELELFDQVHASAHKREVPTHYFFSFALDILRRHKPDLEEEFREVFRLRNLSRRRARQHSQHKAGTLRSVKSEPALQECPSRDGAMSRSCEDVSAQARTAEEVDEIMFRVQGLCVEAMKPASMLTKRHSEINLAEFEHKSKSSYRARTDGLVSGPIDIPSSLPPSAPFNAFSSSVSSGSAGSP